MFFRHVVGLRLWKVAPALLVTAPLVGFAFHLDDRLIIYSAAYSKRDHLFNAIQYAYYSTDDYLNAGNFRPLGRIVEGLVTGFAFEAAEATRLPPHVVMGVFRLMALFILALILTNILVALTRSSRLQPDSQAVVLYPLVLGMVLVANGRAGPLISFSFLYIVAVGLIFLVPLLVARDIDMEPRKLTWHELVGMGFVGVMTAMYYDLVYIAPPLALAFIVARAAAERMSIERLLGCAASRRWSALSIGFLAVFIPSRFVIAARCHQKSCYVGSDISLSWDIIDVLPVRALSATPPAGWSLVSGLVQEYGPEFGIRDLVANSFLVILLAGIVALTMIAARAAASQAGHTLIRHPVTKLHPLHRRVLYPDLTQSRVARFGIVLVLFGLTTVVLSTLLISLSRYIQTTGIDYGWRDTLLTQTGWSFTIIGALVLILGLFRSAKVNRILTIGITFCLGVGLTLTLLANARLTQVDRHSPIASATNLISSASVNIDATETGNMVRCALVDAYTLMEPETSWYAGKVVERLDMLMLDRYGWPFCDPVDQQTEGS